LYKDKKNKATDKTQAKQNAGNKEKIK